LILKILCNKFGQIDQYYAPNHFFKYEVISRKNLFEKIDLKEE